jgi:ATP-dependent DNA ligase
MRVAPEIAQEAQGQSPLEPMEARSAEDLPAEPGWRFEPKWDGFRCLAVKAAGEVALYAKSGKPLTRYFPEVAAGLAALKADDFVLDGELVIASNGAAAFDALQMRLHPAQSRIRKLAAETPAVLVLFDVLRLEGDAIADQPLRRRRERLERFFAEAHSGVLRLSPFTESRRTAQDWLNRLSGSLDGVVAKLADAPYAPGERAMVKVKRLRTADCVVGGFRYLSARREVGSLLLGLYDDAGRLNHVGFATLPDEGRAELTRRLEALIEAPGFTGNAPGGPSRWSTDRSAAWSPLRAELVVEVRYDHVTGGRFRHGTRLLRWRPDKAPRQCRMEQLDAAAAPAAVIAESLREVSGRRAG